MRKFIATISFLILIAIAPALCFAAGSYFKVTSDVIKHNPLVEKVFQRVMTLTFVADDAAGTIPDLSLSDAGWTDGTYSGTFKTRLHSWYGFKVIIDGNHAGTEPTENSELYIYQYGFDLLGAGGVDQVDNSAEREVYFSDGTNKCKQPFVNTITVTVTQQAVVTNSATGTIVIIFTSGE